MQGCWGRWGRRWLGALVLLVVAREGFALDRVGAADQIPYVRIADGHAAVAVRQAVKGASRRLAQPGCQHLLDEFTDPAGRPLRVALEERGLAPENYMDHMRFLDGSVHPRCDNTDINALTVAPGSWLVYVCPGSFRITYARNPNLAEAYLIHEMLHSLGLGENPPSPEEITDRVVTLCRP
jgi:hypothetical protein